MSDSQLIATQAATIGRQNEKIRDLGRALIEVRAALRKCEQAIEHWSASAEMTWDEVSPALEAEVEAVRRKNSFGAMNIARKERQREIFK